MTNLKEAKFVGGIRRADNDCLHVSYIDISACDRKGCGVEMSVSSPSSKRGIAEELTKV